MENRQEDELQAKKWDFRALWQFQDPEQLIHMFPEDARNIYPQELKVWSSLSHHRIINSEIKDTDGIRKQNRESEELKSTLVTTPVVPVCNQVDRRL